MSAYSKLRKHLVERSISVPRATVWLGTSVADGLIYIHTLEPESRPLEKITIDIFREGELIDTEGRDFIGRAIIASQTWYVFAKW